MEGAAVKGILAPTNVQAHSNLPGGLFHGPVHSPPALGQPSGRRAGDVDPRRNQVSRLLPISCRERERERGAHAHARTHTFTDRNGH